MPNTFKCGKNNALVSIESPWKPFELIFMNASFSKWFITPTGIDVRLLLAMSRNCMPFVIVFGIIVKPVLSQKTDDTSSRTLHTHVLGQETSLP